MDGLKVGNTVGSAVRMGFTLVLVGGAVRMGLIAVVLVGAAVRIGGILTLSEFSSPFKLFCCWSSTSTSTLTSSSSSSSSLPPMKFPKNSTIGKCRVSTFLSTVCLWRSCCCLSPPSTAAPISTHDKKNTSPGRKICCCILLCNLFL